MIFYIPTSKDTQIDFGVRFHKNYIDNIHTPFRQPGASENCFFRQPGASENCFFLKLISTFSLYSLENREYIEDFYRPLRQPGASADCHPDPRL